MFFREATVADIPQIQIVRNSVKENMLSDPLLVSDEDCKDIWALFIHPDHEKKGIGQKLQQLMLEWYFSQTKQTIWLERNRYEWKRD